MVYLLQNETSDHQVLYCEHSESMAFKTGNRDIFQIDFKPCPNLEFRDNKAI